jgi:glyoxylase-like metal-dependent hydrolase (beta-lactamase superfamily II)
MFAISNKAPGSVRQRSSGYKFVANTPHPVRILPGLYQIGGGYLSHSRDTCSYLVIDEKTGESILVDCGSHCGYDALKTNLGRVGDPKELKLVIGTHCHWDHVEAFGHLCHDTPARFALHRLDAEAVRTGDPDLTCAGFFYNETFHPFPIDMLLEGGETFEVGDWQLQVFHLPGHTPGCIGVKLISGQSGLTILIPGDAVSGGFSRRVRSSTTTWRKSMRQLVQHDFDYMLPNHLPGNSQAALLTDVPNRLARISSQLNTDFHSFMDHQWI